MLYAQRVFSDGVGGWSYYQSTIDPTPAPSITTPPWSGTITAHQVLGLVPGTEGGTGRTLAVDQINGDDVVAQPNGAPYLTVGAAVAAAVAGDLIYIGAGTYDLAAGIVVPNGVAIRGASVNVCTLRMLAVAANTDLLTMGEMTRVEDLALLLTSLGHHQLRGVVFPGTSSETSQLRVCTVYVSNEGASDVGISNVYGIHATGTGQPTLGVDAVRACNVDVGSSGLGKKRAVLVDGAGRINSRDVNYILRKVGAASGADYICAETDHASAVFRLRLGTLQGPVDGQDCSRTQGILQLGQVDLVSSRSNGLSFTTVLMPTLLLFADPGSMPNNATRYARIGTAALDANEVKIQTPKKAVALGLSARLRIAPAVGTSVTVTVRRSTGGGASAATALTVTLNAGELAKFDLVHGVTFIEGDDLSMSVVTSGSTGAQDLDIALALF